MFRGGAGVLAVVLACCVTRVPHRSVSLTITRQLILPKKKHSKSDFCNVPARHCVVLASILQLTYERRNKRQSQKVVTREKESGWVLCAYIYHGTIISRPSFYFSFFML
ncbi:hypothetical protein F4803DRAFT_422892 [Xylaria telfairii]|nr:hypothetical protein F4803DRAFT_422892 [Xylaria telfairii]